MANTIGTCTSGRIIHLTAIDSDYDPEKELALSDVQLIPGSAGDYAVFKEEDATGPTVLRLESLDGEPRVKYFNRPHHLYMDYSAGSLSTGAEIIITLAV